MDATKEKRRLSAIVVNYNTRDHLRACLESILAERGVDEVLVVDNASQDGSVEMVKAEFPGVRLLASKKNVGFGAANNLAFGRARGDYLLLLNSDIRVMRGAVQRLITFMEDTPDAGVAGGTLLNPDGSVEPSYRFFPTIRNLIRSRRSLIRRLPIVRRLLQNDPIFEEPQKVEVVAGAFMILRREALHRVGGFDPRFFLYVEDTDLCFRMLKDCWTVYVVPGAKAFHIWGGTAQNYQTLALLHHHKSMWRFFEKHYPERMARNFALLIALFVQLSIQLTMVALMPSRKEVGN